MERTQILGLVLALAAFNGIFSPWLFVVLNRAAAWFPVWLPADIRILFLLASLITATATLLAAGVPAALAERVAPALRGRDAVLWIWATGALLLSVPGIIRALLLAFAST